MTIISIVLAALFIQGFPATHERHVDDCYPITAGDLKEKSSPEFDQFPPFRLRGSQIHSELSAMRLLFINCG
jgi:hypothetical protein